jgi:hypothetical protein
MERRETYVDIYINDVHVGTGVFVYTDASQHVLLGATERRVCTSSTVIMNSYAIGNARICFHDNVCLAGSDGVTEQIVSVKVYVAGAEVGYGYVKVVERFAECSTVVHRDIVVQTLNQVCEGVVAGINTLPQMLQQTFLNAGSLALLLAMLKLRGAKE